MPTDDGEGRRLDEPQRRQRAPRVVDQPGQLREGDDPKSPGEGGARTEGRAATGEPGNQAGEISEVMDRPIRQMRVEGMAQKEVDGFGDRGAGGPANPLVQPGQRRRAHRLGQTGIDRAEPDGRDDEALRRELAGGDTGERLDGRLAGDISCLAFQGQRHGHGGDVDDASAPGAHHRLTHRLEAMESPQVVDAYQVGGHLWRREQERVHRGGPGVIDEEVDGGSPP